MHLIKSRNS